MHFSLLVIKPILLVSLFNVFSFFPKDLTIPHFMCPNRIAGTVQLGYCDSDVTVCLLFWNMSIIQDRDVKFPYKRYTYYSQVY